MSFVYENPIETANRYDLMEKALIYLKGLKEPEKLLT